MVVVSSLAAGISSLPERFIAELPPAASEDTTTMTKAEMVRKLEKAYACKDYFPGVLGNPVTFAARWGLPLSKSYLKFKELELRVANRRRRPSPTRHNHNGSTPAASRRRKSVPA